MKLFPIVFFLVFIHSYTCQKNRVNFVDDIDTSIDTFPWMVSIQVNVSGKAQHFCSGALVSDIFALTAAICFDRKLSYFRLFSIHAGIDSIYNGNVLLL